LREVFAGADRSFVGARLSLAGRQFPKAIGPNPTFEGELKGIGARAAALPGPRLLFWVMGVRDLGAYLRDAVRAGYPFSDTHHVHNEDHEYWIGAIGMEVVPHIPSVTEWESRDDGEELAATVGARIVDLTVHHPEA